MVSFVYENLPAPFALASTLAVAATVLHVMFRWRERRRPEAVTLQPVTSRRRCPDSDYRWSIDHRERGPQRIAGCGASPATRAPARERPVGTGRFADVVDYDLTYLDAIDRANALSFPASDPPAYSGPA